MSSHATDDQWMKEAKDVLSSTPLIDGHNDWAMFIRENYGNRIEDNRFAPDADLKGHVDLKRLIAGGVGGVFMSAYVDCPNAEDDFSDAIHDAVVKKTLQQIDVNHRLVEKYSNVLSLVSTAGEILPTFRSGKIPCLIGIEGLHQIGNSASVLRMYHRLGARYVTVTHNFNNLYADSATSKAPVHQGLSEEGRQMIAEMNRIGMIADLSHVSEATMADVFAITKAPVLYTHSNARALCDHPRNPSDASITKLRANGGVLMVTLVPQFTHCDPNNSTVEHVVDHVVHVAGLVGYDHIGLGTDFAGTAWTVPGVDDIAKLPVLVAAMLRRGIARADVEKILGLNVIRVVADAERVAQELRSEPALEDVIEPIVKD